ncbi:MAG: sigma-70 family RNA polymerase sigma factor, partial [Deltaproteobacteria bacterium]|nr:sigma-70 family RNA polymerase sigma factor [Candidatus Anaeroferrophillus wilburensis]MBN2888179.1 sigma-70 family RNA polymerase sigma factor [Deltaproteobacteria bacterium]
VSNNNHLFADDVLQQYLKEVRSIPLLSEEEEIQLAQRVRKGDEEAKKKMIEANLRLVMHLVKKYINRGLPVADLVEEGNLGLIKAVERFDPARNCRFSTYAVWWIRQYMKRAIINQSKVVRLPIHVMEELNLYLKGCRDFIMKYNRDPSLEEVSQYLDHRFSTIPSFLGSFSQMLSLSSGRNDDDDQGGSLLLDQLADKNAVNPMEHLHRVIRLKTIFLWLNELTHKEKYIIIHRFGLYNEDPQTLEEIGQSLGLTRERIRQVEGSALVKLRHIIESHKISLDDLV